MSSTRSDDRSTEHPISPTRGSRLLHGLRILILVPIARLRFLFILGVIGALILHWDDLVARYAKWVRPIDSAIGADPDHEYFCPMHPTVVRDSNKDKCPICFMPLSKRKKGEVGGVSLPAGTVSRVQLSPYRVVLAGVRTVPIETIPLTKEVTTVGTVEFDERRLRAVAARVKGRIEQLVVNETGQQVRQGDPLAVLYSPDLVVTAQNLLDARRSGNSTLEATARDRLRLWGLDNREIDDVIAGGKPLTRLTVRSPITGHVLRKYPREGQYVEEGGPLYDVADLSSVWVQAQLYEDDLAFVPAGGHHPETGRPGFRLPVVAVSRAFPGRVFEGNLSFLFPHVDPDTRTLTARFELPNSDHELRPGMTATVTLRVTADLLAGTPAGTLLRPVDGKLLAVPETCVIDTGRQRVVYRESSVNTFDGVVVDLGARMTGPDGATYFPVLGGLAPGDRVVTAGSFLIDAETRLNPALGSTYIGGSGSKSDGATVRPTTPEDDDAKNSANLARLSPEDRKLAEEQKWCAVLDGTRLGSMGVPVKQTLQGQPVFLCCKGCMADALADPVKTVARAEAMKAKARGRSTPQAPTPMGKIRANLAKLSPADLKLAETQRLCPTTGEPLGSMGVPVKVMVKGKPVFLCCSGCDTDALENPEETLRKVEAIQRRSLNK